MVAFMNTAFLTSRVVNYSKKYPPNMCKYLLVLHTILEKGEALILKEKNEAMQNSVLL